ncbi:MAG: hypothetical protein R2824_09645 [Saprospiraceae bacterium]|nr:hypothetical protein [Lewinella sp.]
MNTEHKTQSSNFHQFDLTTFYLAPFLLLAATIAFSLDGDSNFKTGVPGGILTSFAFIAFIFVVLRLMDLVYATLPRFATAMRILMVYCCFVGFTFGLNAVLTAVTEEAYSFWTMPGAAIFPFSGILWPLSLLITGIVCYRNKILPSRLAALLILCGVLFPAGRIPGNEILNYASDLAFIITFISIARYLKAAPASVGNSALATA